MYLARAAAVYLGKSPQFYSKIAAAYRVAKTARQFITHATVAPDHFITRWAYRPFDTTTTQQVETLINHWYQSTPMPASLWISHEPTQIQRLLAIGTGSHWTMADGQLSNHKLTVDSKVRASVAQGNQLWWC